MDNKNHSTVYYAKLFLLMIIPVYGFCFTLLLSFSKDIAGETKALARGALISRIVFLIVLGIGTLVFIGTILPAITDFINKFDVINILNILK